MNSCSQNGICAYYDENDEAIPVCTPQDFFCRATCVCDLGYFGADCSLNEVSNENVKQIREKLCSNLYATAPYQDLTGQIISQRSSLVLSILNDVNQITPEGFMYCANLIVETAEDALLYSASDSTLPLVYSAISHILDGDIAQLLTSSLRSRVIIAAESLAFSRQSILLTGRRQYPYLTDNINVEVVKTSLDRASHMSFKSPLSNLEAMYNLTRYNFRFLLLNVSNANKYSPIAISTLIYSRNIMVCYLSVYL